MLTEYCVDGPSPIQVLSGRVALYVHQALRRENALRPIGDAADPNQLRKMRRDEYAGTYEVVRPIQFKQGERFWWDGVPPKTHAHAVHPVPQKAEEAVEEGEGEDEVVNVEEATENEIAAYIEAEGIDYTLQGMQHYLDEMGIDYRTRDSKRQLAKRLIEAFEGTSE